MQKNLEFGTTIPSSIPQTDNCIPEKYTRHASPVTRHDFYQWDELMTYQTAEGSQCLCPPGWHVPSEADWTVLFNFYQSASRAGRPLQDTILNGFKALMSGVFYSQSFLNYGDFAAILRSSTLPGSHHPDGVQSRVGAWDEHLELLGVALPGVAVERVWGEMRQEW